MRILHIDTGPEMRGGQYQLLLLARALAGAGHEQTILARKDGELFVHARRAGFNTQPAEMKLIWSLSHAAELVHAHDARAHTMAAIASRRRFVVSRRVAFPVRNSVASQWKYQRATRYLAVSQFVAAQLAAAGIRQEKVDVVYDAAGDIAAINQWTPDAPAVVLEMSDAQKGTELAEHAARLAGVPTQRIRDLETAFQRAGAFVYCSFSEGLGSAVLLAMAAGVPVIASAVGGLVEVIEDGVSGLLVPNDEQVIAAAVRRLYGDPSLAARLIHAGTQRVAAQFTREHLLDRTLQSYRRALDAS